MLHAIGPEATGRDKATRFRYRHQHSLSGVVMCRAWFGLKALAWAWLWWAWALEILGQARIQGLPKPEAWLRLKPGLIYHIWL